MEHPKVVDEREAGVLLPRAASAGGDTGRWRVRTRLTDDPSHASGFLATTKP